MDYNKHTVATLKEELEKRNLSTKRLKQDLIERLEEHDRRKTCNRAFTYRGRDNAERQELGQDHPSDNDHAASTELRSRSAQPPDQTRSNAFNDPVNHLPDRVPGRNENEARRFTDLDDDALEALCRDNFIPFTSDFNGQEKRAIINASHDIKYQEARKKRDVDYAKADKIKEKAQKKFHTDTASARTEKDDKLKEVNIEVAERHRKQNIFRPAFNQLKELKERRGISVRYIDFAPHAQHVREAVRDRDSLHVNASIRERDLRHSSPSSSTVLSSNPTPKRKASQTTFATSSSSEKRARHPSPFENVPRGPQTEVERRPEVESRPEAQSLIEREPIRRQLTNNPYIFISATNIRFRSEYISEIQQMLTRGGFVPEHVRADDTGYFVVFEGSVQGESQTRSCYGSFQGRNFRGEVMHLELCVRGH